MLTEWSLKNRVAVVVLCIVTVVAGTLAYLGLSRLEDPEFTIKDALVVTSYPGASAEEVEQEVTDKLETAIQEMGQLKEIQSMSTRGRSIITASMEDRYDKSSLPQVWDELRRKVNDAQGSLPNGAGPSAVVDDYGDVFGVYFALYGPEYTYQELKEVADFLRRELLQVQDVAKVSLAGLRQEAVYVEFERARMAYLGLTEQQIVGELMEHNVATDAGRVRVGDDYLVLTPTQVIHSVDDFESIPIAGPTSQKQIYLRDVGRVRRGYVEPSSSVLLYDGHSAIGIGISTKSGGNVVELGAAVQQRLADLEHEIPLGMELGVVNYQAEDVTKAISGFLENLAQAVGIVVLVLLLFMGLRSGLIIGFVLLLTILATFVVMGQQAVSLERISLGALVIALGMLVDNAIVVIDGMLVRISAGEDGEQAARTVCTQTARPLLIATAIAILAFAAIGTSEDVTGEFCRSLYTVVLVSMSLSWVTAMTITPLLGVWFLKAPAQQGDAAREGGFLRGYKRFVRGCLRLRWLTIGVVGLVFAASLTGFKYVDQSFFPAATKPQCFVHLWTPEGSHIDYTEEVAKEVAEYLGTFRGVSHVTTMVGQGMPRYVLTLVPEKSNSSYAQLVIDVEDAEAITPMLREVEVHLGEKYADVLAYGAQHELGPSAIGKVQARFYGNDADVLRDLGQQTAAIFERDGDARAVRTDWRQPVKVVAPVLMPEVANLNGITRSRVTNAISETFSGVTAGRYREGDELLPIIVRAPAQYRQSIDELNNIQIYSAAAGRKMPLRDVVSGFDVRFEDPIIMRYNRQRSLTVFADPTFGTANSMLERVRPQVAALALPDGYSMSWEGEYKKSSDAQGPLAEAMPVFISLMILLCVVLFNSIKHTVIIWACVPLSVIGITTGLLLTGQPFGFMALLGALSLIGMLIKNVIVLLDEIDVQRAAGVLPLQAIVDSGASRLRPVGMAASTTALGMLPLFTDAFFASLAVTIVGGLLVATVLTVVVVPVLYAIVYRVSSAEPLAPVSRQDRDTGLRAASG